MARNTGRRYRRGTVRGRSRTDNPRINTYIAWNTTTRRCTDGKMGKPFKRVRKGR